jgi:hypothetical protein
LNWDDKNHNDFLPFRVNRIISYYAPSMRKRQYGFLCRGKIFLEIQKNISLKPGRFNEANVELNHISYPFVEFLTRNSVRKVQKSKQFLSFSEP